jgi:hypothetical protein
VALGVIDLHKKIIITVISVLLQGKKDTEPAETVYYQTEWSHTLVDSEEEKTLIHSTFDSFEGFNYYSIFQSKIIYTF